MLQLRPLQALIIFISLSLASLLFSVHTASAIEISFAAEEGSGSVDLTSDYDVDTDTSVSEEAEATFDGQAKIDDSRSLSGLGEIKAAQRYSGSSGYSGSAVFSASGSGSLTGLASLNPQFMGSSQDVFIDGSGHSFITAKDPIDNWAGVYADTMKGSLSASQRAWTGSAHATSTVHSSGESVYVEADATDSRSESIAYSRLDSTDGVLARFDGTVSAYASHSTDAEIQSHVQGGIYSWVGAGPVGPVPPDEYSERDYLTKPVSADQYLHAHTSSPGMVTDDLTFYAGGPFKIQPAIDVAHSGETINVNPGTYYENLAIDKSLRLSGSGADKTIVDGSNPADLNKASVLRVTQDVNAWLSSMTLQGGTGITDENGASFGGGIFNLGTLTMDDCIISGNNADYGGGVFNYGIATINDCTINSNTATRGGGIFNDGLATVTVNGGTISDNMANWNGGGIYNYYSTATVDGCTISSNLAQNRGGGFFNYQGIATVNDGTISSNSANYGGGIFSDGSEMGGATLTVDGCTISSNTAIYDGGGIYNTGYLLGTAIVTLNDATISGNLAFDGGGIYSDGRWSMGGTIITAKNCIISGNIAKNNGGGIDNYVSEVNLDSSLVSSNHADGYRGWGGGIYTYIGTINLGSSLVTDNHADGYEGAGGGIYNDGGTVNMDRGSVSYNHADGPGGKGGGIYNSGWFYEGDLIVPGILNLGSSGWTIAWNSASTGNGGGIHNDAGGVVNDYDPSLIGTKIHDNSVPQVVGL